MVKEKWDISNSGGSIIKAGVGHPEVIAVLKRSLLKITPKVEARAKLMAAAPDLKSELGEMLELIEEMRIRLVQKHGDQGGEHWDERVLAAIGVINKIDKDD